MRTLLVVAMLLSSAPAWAQGPCTTQGTFLFATSEADFDRATTYFAQRDNEAVSNLVRAGRADMLKAGVEVFVMERKAGKVQIRPKGQTGTVWTYREAVNCP